jgi:hypothetical protein
MTMLVTLDEAKLHLRVDHDADDDDITLKIEAASAAVLAYVEDSQYLFLDTGGDEIDLFDTSTDQAAHRAKHLCRQATLLMVGEFYRNREPAATDVVPERFGYGYLPRAVVALLTPLRVPTIA